MSDLLPINATKQERAISLATARIGDISVKTRDLYNPDNCPVELLPWLAWSLNVDNWDSGWSELQKRSFLKEQYLINKYKGTTASIKKIANSLDADVIIKEWFEYTPAYYAYTFTCNLALASTPVAQQESIFTAITLNKPARCGMTMLVSEQSQLPILATLVSRVAIHKRDLLTLN